ncbi:hypothetical protein HUN01_02730 (plasmid) [Nostoc edaphicum CCNP1411]|uniref:Uncharacterized protein n=1 Tax=Nostoc edaphicum CCNP1411 TaxID=1472755 RepID=A0A7D7L8D6_9NOSO|nr:hypothetical protein [Nostoc edaphicum]QMS86533.1 hypothetical protein HUN01_02730 [Nostoc edaphicum CCNP1411]
MQHSERSPSKHACLSKELAGRSRYQQITLKPPPQLTKTEPANGWCVTGRLYFLHHNR